MAFMAMPFFFSSSPSSGRDSKFMTVPNTCFALNTCGPTTHPTGPVLKRFAFLMWFTYMKTFSGVKEFFLIASATA